MVSGGSPLWIGLIVRFSSWLGRIARPSLGMSRAPLITTSHGLGPSPAASEFGETCASMVLLVVAVAGVADALPYVPGKKKNSRGAFAGEVVALSAALIVETDSDGLKIVTFIPNGFVG